jgi:excisionase family DNA binding protein
MPLQVEKQYLTPPEVARRLGCATEKIIGWILAGELRGSNLAARLGGRPRYRIAEADLEEFLDRRSAAVAPAPRRRRASTTDRRFY